MNFKKITRWIGRRAKERSTYAGLATIATIAGAEKLGVQIDQVGIAASLILGGGLVAHTPEAE